MDTKELGAKAEAASVDECGNKKAHYTQIGLSNFTAAATPSVILSLLEELDSLRSSNEAMRKALASCQWYWPENDTSSDACADSPREIAETWDTKPGDIFGYSRGGVVETRYYGFLPAADDADSDDDFEVDEPTEEAAEAKMQAEIARREALSSPIKEKSND